ncbi:hypothetical protein BGX27_006022 [Mortierella sp. AM989]|nr:hypothetical protein BGX27_006022 [Mortierella sp. AM989]
MKYKSRQRRHKALEQDDMFDHLPIDPSSPAPLMKMTSGTGHHYPHHHGNDNYYQQNMHNQGEMHGHELEPMYENGGEYNQMHHMDHTGGDMHHDYHNHHHDTHYDHDPGQTNMQSDMHNHSHGYDNPYQDQPGQSNMHHQEPGFNQGGNGQGFQGDGGQGFQGDGGQGFQGGDGQGFQGGDGQGFQGNGGQGFQGDGSQGFTQTQPTSTPGSGGMMNQCPTPGDPGISQLNPVQTVGGIQQLPIAGFSGGLPPAPVPPLVNRPNTGSKPRPDSSNQYSILMPTSPTNSTFSGEGGLIDGTSIPAQGAMTIAPLPLDYRHSIASSNDSWEDKSQEYGYSPQSKQALLNQTRYYDASASQHNSGRVFASPNIATISAINPSGVRSPQDATQVDVYGSATSAGFASSLNTFDRRHPQSHEEAQGTDSLFHVASRDSRNPQDNHR